MEKRDGAVGSSDTQASERNSPWRAASGGNAPLKAPAAPPNGTYVYELSRNGTMQGKTTVVVLRRDEFATIDTAEAGDVGAAHAHVLASYRYRDFGIDSYVATFAAPFLRTWQAGFFAHPHPHLDFYDQTTLRYRSIGERTFVSVDGNSEAALIATSSHAHTSAPWIFDAPFMTGALLLPAFQRRTNEAEVAPFSVAFGLVAIPRKQTLQSGPPQYPKTPKSDRFLAVAGLANVWFDAGNYIVHEAHFTSLNIDARLVSYSRALEPAAFAPAPPQAPRPKLDSTEIAIESDGKTLAGTLSRPKSAKKMPAVVLVPPGPQASRNFDNEGPNATFTDLTYALVARGYAVVRYDTRGVGKSGGSNESQTWDTSLADAEAVVRFTESAENIDPTRVYVLGYGNGADLALASASSPNASESVAGVVALAPTTLAYRECDRHTLRTEVEREARIAGAPSPDAETVTAMDAALGIRSPRATPVPTSPPKIEGGVARREDAAVLVRVPDAAWRRSSYAHDPAALAARAKQPALVFHPGIAICGETADETASYDDRLRAENPRAIAISANDLTARFGGRYDADSLANTEAIFPFRFDASTAGAIADWLDSPKAATGATPRFGGANVPTAPRNTPPPPPAFGRSGTDAVLPNAHPATPRPRPRPSDVTPGQVEVPSTFDATAAPATASPATSAPATPAAPSPTPAQTAAAAPTPAPKRP